MQPRFKKIGTDRADRIAQALLQDVPTRDICLTEQVTSTTVSRIRRNRSPQVSPELRAKVQERFGIPPEGPSHHSRVVEFCPTKPRAFFPANEAASAPSRQADYVAWLEEQNRRLVELLASCQELLSFSMAPP